MKNALYKHLLTDIVIKALSVHIIICEIHSFILFISWCTYHIAGNFAGEDFCKFRKLQAICENFICECLVLIDKDSSIALIRKNTIRKILDLANSRTFFLRKFPAIRYVPHPSMFCSLRSTESPQTLTFPEGVGKWREVLLLHRANCEGD